MSDTEQRAGMKPFYLDSGITIQNVSFDLHGGSTFHIPVIEPFRVPTNDWYVIDLALDLASCTIRTAVAEDWP
jgi:hypothetical protein